MKHLFASVLIVSATLRPGPLATPAHAATMILHNFTGGTSDGSTPSGSLTLSGSTLYGMTIQGGSSIGNGEGTIFTMNTDGSGFTLLRKLAVSDGTNPHGALTLSGSKLYGMATTGGGGNSGAVFSMNTDGTGYSVLHSFHLAITTDGASPYGDLTLSGSKLYGMTENGGLYGDGTIFSMNTDGTGFALLHSFVVSTHDGINPYGSLTLLGSKLYGMFRQGGTTNYGGIFSINTDGSEFTILHSFADGASDGAVPYGSLTFAGSKLFGLTSQGGSSNSNGTLFSMNLDGTGYSLLHSFNFNDGFSPWGSLALSGSTLYGMTSDGVTTHFGTLFSIGIDGTGYELLEKFQGAPGDPASPLYGAPTISEDGLMLFGMSPQGGSANKGVVFARAITPPVPEPGAFALLGLGTLLLAARRRV
jgi:uncharacterized repeat protein (TIGR03803 family)